MHATGTYEDCDSSRRCEQGLQEDGAIPVLLMLLGGRAGVGEGGEAC